MIPTPPSAITGRVMASSPDNTSKVFRNGIADFGHLRDVAAGFFHAGDVRDFGQPRQRAGFDVRAGAARDVVKNERLVHGFGDGAEVPVLAFLRGLVVVGRRGEDAHSLPGARPTSLAFSTASWVEFEVAPATMGTRPATTSIVISMTCSHSSCESVGVSPVVPQGTRKSMPDSTCHATRLRRAVSSMEPSCETE